MNQRWIGWTAALVALGMLAAAGRVHAQVETPTQGLTLAELQMRLKRAQSETELEPKLKQEVIETYQAALERLEIANEAADTAKVYLDRIQTIPEELARVREKLSQLPED